MASVRKQVAQLKRLIRTGDIDALRQARELIRALGPEVADALMAGVTIRQRSASLRRPSDPFGATRRVPQPNTAFKGSARDTQRFERALLSCLGAAPPDSTAFDLAQELAFVHVGLRDDPSWPLDLLEGLPLFGLALHGPEALVGLEGFDGLTVIQAESNRTIDVAGLRSEPLRHLSLRCGRLEGSSALADLPLETLELFVPLPDDLPLASMHSLRRLDLRVHRPQHVQAIAELPLRHLTLRTLRDPSGELLDMTPLQDMTELEELHFVGHEPPPLPPNLERLRLSSVSASPLRIAEHPRLAQLHLRLIGSHRVELEGLPSLWSLSIERSGQIREVHATDLPQLAHTESRNGPKLSLELPGLSSDQLARNEDPEARRLAAERATDLQLLARLLDDPDPRPRRAAAQSLRRLGGTTQLVDAIEDSSRPADARVDALIEAAHSVDDSVLAALDDPRLRPALRLVKASLGPAASVPALARVRPPTYEPRVHVRSPTLRAKLPSLDIAEAVELILGPRAGCDFDDTTQLPPLPHLRRLEIHTRYLQTLAPLRHLETLHELVVGASVTLRSLDGIENLRALRSLGIHHTSIADLKPLAGLPLERLVAPHTKISDLRSLESVPTLTFLSLEGAPIVHLNGLEKLTALEELVLAATQVRDLSPIAGLPQLRRLDLRQVAVEDLSPIATLPHLTHIDLFHGRVRDPLPLLRHRSLRSVRIGNTPVAEDETAMRILRHMLERRGGELTTFTPKLDARLAVTK